MEPSRLLSEWMARVGLKRPEFGSEFHVPLVLRATDYNRFRLFQCRLRGADQWTLRSYGAEDASDILVPLTLSGGDFSQMTQAHLVTGQGGNWSGSDSGAGTTFSESEFLVFRTGVDAKVGKAHTNLADVNFSSCLFPEDFQFTRVLVSGANFTGATLNSTNGVDSRRWMPPMPSLRMPLCRESTSSRPTSQEPLLVEQTTGVTWGICPDGSSSATSNNTCCGTPLGVIPNAGCTILTQADVASSSFADSTQHTNAYFVGLDLNDVDFSGADLRFSVFQNCTADGTDFKGATLDAALFTVTDLSTATLDSVKYPRLYGGSCPTALPATWFCQNGTLWGPGVEYQGVDFNGLTVTLSDPGKFMHLEGANLQEIQELTLNLSGSKGILGGSMIATATTNFHILADFITTESTLNDAVFNGSSGFRLSSYGSNAGSPSIRSTNPRISPVSFPDQCTDQNRSGRELEKRLVRGLHIQ